MPTRDSVIRNGGGGLTPSEEWLLNVLRFLTTSLGEKTFTVVAKPIMPGMRLKNKQLRLHVISVQKNKFVIQNMEKSDGSPDLIKTRDAARMLREFTPAELTVLGRSGDGGSEEKYKITHDGRVYVASIDGVEAEVDVRVLVPKVQS